MVASAFVVRPPVCFLPALRKNVRQERTPTTSMQGDFLSTDKLKKCWLVFTGYLHSRSSVKVAKHNKGWQKFHVSSPRPKLQVYPVCFTLVDPLFYRGFWEWMLMVWATDFSVISHFSVLNSWLIWPPFLFIVGSRLLLGMPFTSMKQSWVFFFFFVSNFKSALLIEPTF